MLLEALFLFAEGEQTIKRCFRRSRTISYTRLKESKILKEASCVPAIVAKFSNGGNAMHEKTVSLTLM